MVMKYIDGFKILDADSLSENNVNVDEVLANVMKSYAFQIYTLG